MARAIKNNNQIEVNTALISQKPGLLLFLPQRQNLSSAQAIKYNVSHNEAINSKHYSSLMLDLSKITAAHAAA
ncbi:MAG: hypothetical protein JW841_04605 [Deltaproteobacteria bacterium]|nr:hypothetical protein [Deltaproteobacteria bacterium]